MNIIGLKPHSKEIRLHVHHQNGGAYKALAKTGRTAVTGSKAGISSKKQAHPRVSVIMPVHNAQAYLKEAILSILHQTYRDFELIIIDDASKDNSWKIITQLQKQHKRIRAFRNKVAMGKSGDPASNLAISKAKGEFIAKMDADDIAHPKRLEKQVTFLDNHPEIFLTGTQGYVINKEGKIIGKKKSPLKHHDIFADFFLYSYFIHPSIMFRNETKKQPFYKIKFPFFNEYYTFFKLMTEGKHFANMPEYLLYYRIHGENDTLSNTKKKFLSTLRMRWEFIRLGYLPTIRQVAITLLQSIFVFSLPERAIPFFYLLSRNVITPKQILTDLKDRFMNIFHLEQPLVAQQ